jgi:hypothetical protein
MIASMRRSSMGLLPFLLLGFYFTIRQSYLFLDTARLAVMNQQQPHQTQHQRQRQAILQSDKPFASSTFEFVTENTKPFAASRVNANNSIPKTMQIPKPPSPPPMNNNKVMMRKNSTNEQQEVDDEHACPPHCLPKIVWLLSFPNSGTSFTMSLTERASNLSFASNYGDEVTARGHRSLPVHMAYPTGPYWEGVSSAASMGRAVRPLPVRYVLTKTHCGGRCIDCGPDGYVISKPQTFLNTCARTSARTTRGKPGAGPRNTTGLGRKMEFQMEYRHGRVAKVIHLIRNPIHNIVARFHLDRKNRIKEEPKLAEHLHLNATGFRRWCTMLDFLYANPDGHSHHVEDGFHPSWDNATRNMFQHAPCRAEFFKYTQWHNRVLEMRPLLFATTNIQNHYDDNSDNDDTYRDVVLTIHYEDYAKNLTRTTMSILDFLEQERVPGTKLRPFREKQTGDRFYQDYFRPDEYTAIRNLIQHVSNQATWKRIQHYFPAEEKTTTATSTTETTRTGQKTATS